MVFLEEHHFLVVPSASSTVLHFQVRNHVPLRQPPLLQPPLGGDPRVLDRLLQFRPKPAHLRLLQPRVQDRVQEDPPELL